MSDITKCVNCGKEHKNLDDCRPVVEKSVTEAQVREILEAESKATQGDWKVDYWRGGDKNFRSVGPEHIGFGAESKCRQDGAFMSIARKHVRPLCESWLKLKEENERLRCAVEQVHKIALEGTNEASIRASQICAKALGGSDDLS